MLLVQPSEQANPDALVQSCPAERRGDHRVCPLLARSNCDSNLQPLGCQTRFKLLIMLGLVRTCCYWDIYGRVARRNGYDFQRRSGW